MADTKVYFNGSEHDSVELADLGSAFLGGARFHLECARYPENNEPAVELLRTLETLVDAENELAWRLAELRG